MTSPISDKPEAVAWRWRPLGGTVWVVWNLEPKPGCNLVEDAVVEIEPLFPAEAITRLSSELAASRDREMALERERDELKAEEVEWKEAVQGEYNRAEHHKAKREAAEAEVKRLREALEPLAGDADNWADTVPDDYRPRCTEPGKEYAHPGSETAFTVGDLRRARALADANTQGGDNAAD